ncbi:MAG: methionine ABC transporter ATP-binding protein [Rhodospirillaceae bacterium]|jgi:putative ABC transport system ATP-binding protein|nr:methionine ABC transporter ATP-binding protein [Rhodospirillaceae bacterium]|tara:strand:- start:2 stop:700 length:699 start_codon:yes stop_codon:yes gene_type:complete
MTEFAINLDNVCFSWKPGTAPVLDIPHLAVPAGERLLIQGPSGSGKTTLLSLLGGIITPQTGTVDVLGTTLTQLNAAQRDSFRADHIGFVFQMFNLVPYLSLADNVTLPCQFSAVRRATALANAADLTAAATHLLSQLELDICELAGRPITELSVGQQQRVAAARALIGAPPLIIADEPTSALDADARQLFLELLFREVEGAGATLIFVSHDLDLRSCFDRTLPLADINRAT